MLRGQVEQPFVAQSAVYMDSPFGVAGAGARLSLMLNAATALLLTGAVLAAAALVLRLRRATGDERQRLKRVVFAASAARRKDAWSSTI